MRYRYCVSSVSNIICPNIHTLTKYKRLSLEWLQLNLLIMFHRLLFKAKFISKKKKKKKTLRLNLEIKIKKLFVVHSGAV